MIYNTRLSLLLLFLITTISSVFAQQKLTFRVADFSYDAFDQTARDERFKRYDGSGFLYAIVKVSGDSPADKLGEYRFNFGNMNHIVEDHDGELWLYVQKNAKIVTITRNGYFPVNHYDLNTTIEGGKTYRMKLSAQAAKVYTQMVMFEVTPADSKAVITIKKEGDGQGCMMFGTIDETGGAAKNLRYGTYTYEVLAENYHSSEGRFTLDNKAETHIEKVSLCRNGTKVILDAGVDADIYVNGIKRGSGRWTGVLKVGNYKVECRKANHRPSLQNISVKDGKDSIFLLAYPKPITGILSVTSRPLGANIKIDGRDYGTTPRNIQDILIGHHNVVVSKNGYITKTEECNISENETFTVELALDKSQDNIPQTLVSGDDKVFKVVGVTFTMKPVAGGTFTMGATPEQASEAENDEKPKHNVTLNDYYICETEVTQELWQAVMGYNPSYFKVGLANLPVESVSWNDCQKFIKKLNKITGQNFRLPTEAEWEYAARGGKYSRGYKYAGGNDIDNVAWYVGNSGNNTHAVKTKSPNELGLYDMSGNVWEWCQDKYGNYSKDAQFNPFGPISGAYSVRRGGGWGYFPKYCRVSTRGLLTLDERYYGFGLRLAMD